MNWIRVATMSWIIASVVAAVGGGVLLHGQSRGLIPPEAALTYLRNGGLATLMLLTPAKLRGFSHLPNARNIPLDLIESGFRLCP